MCPVEWMHSRVCNIKHVAILDKREHQRLAKANAATGAAIHRSNTPLANARFLDSRVHTQIQQRSPIACYTSQSTKAQRPAGSLYVHTQETVDQTLLRVAVCSLTVVSRLSVHVRLSLSEEKE